MLLVADGNCRPQDLIIAVMGITGSGKSTFISRLVGGDEVVVGHSLTSCKQPSNLGIDSCGLHDVQGTAGVRVHSFIYKSTRRIFLIDTPGFNDTNRNDTDILKDVAFFLSKTYKGTNHLAGIIYLHRITDRRMQGTNVKNLKMFKKLCGEKAYKHVVLATTMWDDIPTYDEGIKRERELINTKEWWGHMYEQGSKILRHNGERDSALAVIAELVNSSGPVVLQIQREMVEEHKDLEDTAAGQEVEKELQDAQEKFRANIRGVEEEHRKAMEAKDHDTAETLQQQREEWDIKLQRATQDQADLKINFERLEKEKEAEICKLVAELAEQEKAFRKVRAQQDAELKQIQIARQKDIEEYRNLQAQHDQDFEMIRREMAELGQKRRVRAAPAEGAKNEVVRFQKLKADAQQDFLKRQEAAAQKEDQLKQEIQATQSKGEKRARLWKSMQVLMVLAGLGVTVAGVVTVSPALVVAGSGLMTMPIGGKSLNVDAS